MNALTLANTDGNNELKETEKKTFEKNQLSSFQEKKTWPCSSFTFKNNL